MPTLYDTDILIVGAGPVGLMAACQLQRFGVRHRLIDRRDEPNTKSKASGIWCRSMEVFDGLGIADAFREQGTHCHSIAVYVNGEPIGGTDLRELRSRDNYLINLPQDRTEALLREHYISRGGLVEMSTDLSSLTQSANSIEACIRTAAGESTVSCQYLMACDGIGSTVRDLLGVPLEGRTIPADWIVGDVKVDGPIAEDEVSAFLHKTGPCLFFPMGKRRHRIVGLIGDRPNEHPTVAEFQELVDTRTQRPLILSEELDIAYFRIQERQIKQYRSGRCFFNGDAAHVHSPVGGQGLNTGIQDAHNLAWKLALATRGYTKNDTLIDSYHAERHPIASKVLEGTGRATQMIMMQSPLLQQVRNHAISFLASLPVIQAKGRDSLSELKVNYREGPLARDAEQGWLHKHLPHAGPRPGDYHMDVPLLNVETDVEYRLSELLRPAKFHLVLFQGKDHTAVQSLLALAGVVEATWPTLIQSHVIVKDAPLLDGRPGLVDLRGAAHTSYHVETPTACLIRPDGYIASILHDPTVRKLAHYLEGIGLS